jgi:hypothetical protein
MTSRVQHQLGIARRQRAASAALASITGFRLCLSPPNQRKRRLIMQRSLMKYSTRSRGSGWGSFCAAGLVFDSAGSLYDSTEYRAALPTGGVFKLDTTEETADS